MVMIVPFVRRADDEGKPVHCKPVTSWLKMCVSDIITIVCMALFLIYLIWGLTFTLRLYRSARSRRRAGEPIFHLPSCLFRDHRLRKRSGSANGSITQFTVIPPLSLGGDIKKGDGASIDLSTSIASSFDDSPLLKHALLPPIAVPAYAFHLNDRYPSLRNGNNPYSPRTIQPVLSSTPGAGLGFGDTLKVDFERSKIELCPPPESATSKPTTSPMPIVEKDPILTPPPSGYIQCLLGQGRGRRNPVEVELEGQDTV